jgi:predicted kinase
MHLIVGPVGAGKSTFARTLSARQGAVLLVLDDWMARLYGADERPATERIAWYIERRDRCLDQIWAVADAVCRVGADVVLEVGLIQRAERDAFYRRVEDAEHALAVYVIDAPRDVRRERVLRRNVEQGETFAQVVPLEFFELASDMWQPPDEEEVRARRIEFPVS